MLSNAEHAELGLSRTDKFGNPDLIEGTVPSISLYARVTHECFDQGRSVLQADRWLG